MQIGSHVKIERVSSSKSYDVDTVVDESKLFWYVGERRIKFSKDKLLSVGSTKWAYEKIEDISNEEYDLFLEEKQKKINIANLKSNILKSIQNDYFFREISFDDLAKLNSLIEELKIKILK
jgi:hypothetical protein